MPRNIELGAGVTIIPNWLVQGVERDIDAHRAEVFIVYPDGTTGGQLMAIVEDAKEMQKETHHEDH